MEDQCKTKSKEITHLSGRNLTVTVTFSLVFPEEPGGPSELGVDGENDDFAGGRVGALEEVVEEGVVGRLEEEEDDDDDFRDRNGEIDDRSLDDDIGREREREREVCGGHVQAGEYICRPLYIPPKYELLIFY